MEETPQNPAPAPEQPPVSPQKSTDEQVLQYIIPINRSGWSIASGYLAFFNFLIITAPVTGTLSILFGILGLKDIEKHPGRLGKGRSWFGIITGGLALLAVILIWVSSLASS